MLPRYTATAPCAPPTSSSPRRRQSCTTTRSWSSARAACSRCSAPCSNSAGSTAPRTCCNSSSGFVTVPPREEDPTNEIWNLDHPLHRKIREVIVSGAPVLFAAGNCGEDCPSGNCHASSIAGISIHGSNSLEEVITVAAVNSNGDRIGYSSQGPGMFGGRSPTSPVTHTSSETSGPGGPAVWRSRSTTVRRPRARSRLVSWRSCSARSPAPRRRCSAMRWSAGRTATGGRPTPATASLVQRLACNSVQGAPRA